MAADSRPLTLGDRWAIDELLMSIYPRLPARADRPKRGNTTMSRLATVFADYVREDPIAFEGLEFMSSTDPKDVATKLIDYLENELEDVKFANDSMGLGELLNTILKSYEFSGEELTEIGQAIIDTRK
jgi:hypothetical protein